MGENIYTSGTRPAQVRCDQGRRKKKKFAKTEATKHTQRGRDKDLRWRKKKKKINPAAAKKEGKETRLLVRGKTGTLSSWT